MSICLCKKCKGLWIDFRKKNGTYGKELCPNCEVEKTICESFENVTNNLTEYKSNNLQ